MRPRTLQSGKHYQQVEAWYIQHGKHNYYFESYDTRRKDNTLLLVVETEVNINYYHLTKTRTECTRNIIAREE